MISFHQSVHQFYYMYMFHLFEMLSDFSEIFFTFFAKIYVIIQYRYADMSSHTRKTSLQKVISNKSSILIGRF